MKKEKNFTATLLLCLLLGFTGAHRFYTGYIIIGVLQLILSMSFIGFPIMAIWVFIDLIAILSGKYNAFGEQEPIKPTFNPVLKKAIFIFLISIGLFFVLCTIIGLIITLTSKESYTHNPNIITKDTFEGEWAFNADSVEIYCVDLKSMTGAKIKVNGKDYAITHNISDIPFMPDDLWADKPMNGALCDGAYIDDDVCKASLADTYNYVDTHLCNFPPVK